MENTFFNSEYPICKFMHQFVSGSLWILSITKPRNNKTTTNCKTIIIQSTKEPTMTLESDFVIETYETYPIVGNNAPKDAPSINPNSVELIVKLVKNPSGLITGIQLSKNGDILLAQRFLAPLELDQEVASTDFKLQVEKIIGFPVNDMKMQVTLMGVSSNGCKRACPCCISPRENFRCLPDCLLQKMTALNPAIVFTFVARDTAGDDSFMWVNTVQANTKRCMTRW